MIFLQLTVEGYDNNFTYIIGDEETKNAIVVDPAGSNEKVENEARDNGLRIKYIINTHSHEDHTIGNNYFLKRGARLMDEDFNLGKIQIKMIRTPGHSPDSKCILAENKLLTGDTLFVGSIGAVHFEGGSEKEMRKSLNKLMKLDPTIEVWPGHDYGQKNHSTIGEEKRSNPFV